MKLIKVRLYLYNVLIGVDQLLNAMIGFNPDQCVSTTLATRFPDSFARKAIDKIVYIIFGQKDHCLKSSQRDNDSRLVLELTKFVTGVSFLFAC